MESETTPARTRGRTARLPSRAAACLALFTLTTAASSPPADPAMGARTKALLLYLQDRPNKSTNRVLSGQFAGYPNVQYIQYNSFDIQNIEDVYRETGKYPAIIGSDYTGRLAQESNCRRIHTGHNQSLINYAKAGGIVALTAHYYRPDFHGGSQCGLRRAGYPAYDLNRILPGGADRTKWISMLDATATGLAQLRDAGVPVLWRPLHEVGGSFWWTQEPAKFKLVWQDMFRYFTQTKKLNNLIWSYTGNKDNFPGYDYVDLIGDDVYAGAPASTLEQLAATGSKVYAYTEFGPQASSGYDFRNLINTIRGTSATATYFLVWADSYRLGNPGHNYQRELMNDSWVVDRSEVSLCAYGSPDC